MTRIGARSTHSRGSSLLPRTARAGLLLSVLFACACGDERTDRSGPPDVPPPRVGPAVAARTWPRVPLFELTRGSGEAFGIEDLAGRVWIALFVRGQDAGTENARIPALAKFVEETNAAADGKRASVVALLEGPREVGLSPLRIRLAGHGVDAKRWTILTGAPGEVGELREEWFGASAERPDPLDVFVVDRFGRIRERMDVRTADGLAALRQAMGPLIAERAPKRAAYPPESLDPKWLAPRAADQIEASKSWSVRHDFRFRDRRRASGIRFLHRSVDDSGFDYRQVHYDHGSGVAIADVDGDGLYDVYFSNQAGSNQLWRNLGGGRFEDVTARAGVAFREPCGVTASFADTDNDGDPDLYVTSVRGGNLLFVNDGTGRFEDVTADSGLAYTGHSSSGVFFDYDRDGLLDLFLCNVGVYTNEVLRTVRDDSTTSGQEPGPFTYYEGVTDAFSGHLKKERTERSILYRNLGGNRFRDVSAETGLLDTSWTGDASPVDMNEDGWIDLYVLNMQGHDEYYENVGGKKFVKKSREIFPRTPWGSMGIKVFDFDQDGALDIYLTDMHSDMSIRVWPEDEKRKAEMIWPESLLLSGGKSIFGNAFFRRTAPNEVEEISDAIGAENYWPWGLSVGDLNADGYDDVFIASSMNYYFRYGINSVLLNDAGKRFVDSEFVLGVEPRHGPLFKPWFELDCLDLEDATHELCEGVQVGVVTAWAPLGSRSSVIFDLDGDGDLDIITNDMNSEPLVLVSDLAEHGELRFLKIRLEGTKSNRDGLGSIVRVHAGGRVRTQVHDGKSGYLSQSSQPLYFGLGDTDGVKHIEVTWPSGTKQIVGAPKDLTRTLVIREE